MYKVWYRSIHKIVLNREGGYGPRGGAVILLYAGERELPVYLDQGDLIRAGSIGVGVGVALSDRRSYPGSLSTMDCMASSLSENIW
ncbi:hypothetical protein F2Q69_00013492 [Brassica cretica]|uniref:Uncharacterized protein n=1 Tax=Brassica cretica TaxID=69181 RepID=A0A8S9R631_BRACR|nr:hypothetical protein F2Q69_00013492 [Brassica cretica]